MNETLAKYIEIVPVIKDALGMDIMMSVTDGDEFLAYWRGDKMVADIKVGDKLNHDDPMWTSFTTGKKLEMVCPADVYGFAFVLPLFLILAAMILMITVRSYEIFLENERLFSDSPRTNFYENSLKNAFELYELRNDEEKLKKAQEKAKAEREKLEAQLKEAEGKLAAAGEADKAEAEKLRAEAEALRKQLAMSSREIVIFKLRFSAWQEAHKLMAEAFAALPDEETKEKMRAAIRAQVKAWRWGE